MESNYWVNMHDSLVMSKLYSIMKQNIRTWVDHNHKWSLAQVGFRPKHSTINHLVTLKVIMEESWLQAQHSIIVVLWNWRNLWQCTKKWALKMNDGVRMSLGHKEVVARLCAQVRCHLTMDIGFFKYLLSNLGVKQVCT